MGFEQSFSPQYRPRSQNNKKNTTPQSYKDRRYDRPFPAVRKRAGHSYETIKLFNRYKINYLIVTKSSLVADDKYLDIYDKELAHFQITITNTDDYKCLLYEKASKVSDRIKAIEKLHSLGFDVSVRLSPFIYGFIDFKVLNDIDCDKILVEYLKVNHWIKKWFNIDYDSYSLKYGGYLHLQLSDKKEQLESIDNFGQLSVGEYVKDHHSYFSENVNYNSDDCCNLSFVNMRKPEEQINLFSEVNYEN